jgi:hypothetical protein
MGLAKIEAGIVAQIDRTSDAPRAGWILCGDDIVPGYLYAGGVFSAPAPDARAAILRQISALEASVTPRRAREAILSDAGRAWLANVDAQIATLRGQL